MRFICFGLLTLFCSYSLGFAAPINPTPPKTEEAKHQKATEIAQRLLKQMAEEKITDDSNSDGDDVPPIDSVSQREKQLDKISGILSMIDELYPMDEGLDGTGDVISPKMDELDEILPVLQQQSSDDSTEEKDSDEDSLPVMDDLMMRAEDH